MGENSKIEWTDHTFNPWRGCTKVSAGCDNCYADTMSKRNPGMLGIWGPNGSRVVASEEMWKAPLRWDREAEKSGERRRVFCASLADVFEDWNGCPVFADGSAVLWCQRCESFVKPSVGHHGVSCSECDSGAVSMVSLTDVRNQLFALIDATPHLDWLLLTKRPENIRRMWPCYTTPPHNQYRENVWLGTSVENQEAADKRIPELLKCRDLSPVLFLSCEPLLGAVDLGVAFGYSPSHGGYFDLLKPSIDWVIAGGESGPGARPMHPDWVRSLRDQCQAAGVPFHFKQWGEWGRRHENGITLDDAGDYSRMGFWDYGNWSTGMTTANVEHMVRVGKSKAGRLLDSREWNEFPKVDVQE